MQNSLHFSMKWLVCLWSISYVYAKEDTEEIKYHYRENIEVIHEDTALLDLFTLPLASNSSFIFNVYTSISGARRVDVQRRNLTYILACTPTAYDTIQAGRDEYCKNGLYTSDICTLYPLPATGSSSTFYASEQLIEGNAPFFEGGGKQDIHFMLTNCEIYGGDSNILRSCLKPLLSEDCHYCPNVEMEEDERKYRKENCRIPPLMHGAITFRASYTYCTFSDSDCLPVHQKQIPTVLGCLMGIWCIGLFLWIRNIHTHSHIATTSIQKIMTLLPIFYIIYLIFRCISWSLVSSSMLFDTSQQARYMLGIVSGVTHAMTNIVWILLAMGYGVTRNSLRLYEGLHIICAICVSFMIWRKQDGEIDPPAAFASTQFFFNGAQILLIFIIYISTGENIAALSYQHFRLASIGGIDIKKTSVNLKREMMIYYRDFYLTYFAFAMVTHLILISIDMHNSYFSELMQEGLYLLFVWNVARLCKCRIFIPEVFVTYAHGYVEDVQYGVIVLSPSGRDFLPITYDHVHDFKDMPTDPEEALSRQPKERVMVLQPNLIKLLGTSRYNDNLIPSPSTKNPLIRMAPIAEDAIDEDTFAATDRSIGDIDQPSVIPVDHYPTSVGPVIRISHSAVVGVAHPARGIRTSFFSSSVQPENPTANPVPILHVVETPSSSIAQRVSSLFSNSVLPEESISQHPSSVLPVQN